MEYSREGADEPNPFSYKNFLNRYGTSRDGLPPGPLPPAGNGPMSLTMGGTDGRNGGTSAPSFHGRGQQPQQLSGNRFAMPGSRVVPPVRLKVSEQQPMRLPTSSNNGGVKNHEIHDIFADSGDADSGDDDFSSQYPGRRHLEWLNGQHDANGDSWLHPNNNIAVPPASNNPSQNNPTSYFHSDFTPPTTSAPYDLSNGPGLLPPVRRNSSERSLSNRLAEPADSLSGVDFSANSRLDDRMLINKLRKDVAIYKHKLEEVEGYADQTAQELQRCNAEKDAMRIREREETAAMEKVMQHVEANLQSATRRALDAEGALSAMIDENRALKEHIAEVTAENDDLRLRCTNDVRRLPALERAHSLARFLQAGCQSANLMLRDMMDGVEQIHLASVALESLGTVEEVKQSTSQSSSAERISKQQISTANKEEL